LTVAGTSGSAWSAKLRRWIDPLEQHGDEALAFACARLPQAGDAAVARHRARSRRASRPARLPCTIAGFVNRQALRVREPALDRALESRQAVQLLGLRLRPHAVCAAPRVDAQLDLAAPEGLGQLFAQRRLERTEFVRKAKHEVEKSAVDGPEFDADVAAGLSSDRRRFGDRMYLRDRCLDGPCGGACIAGHAVNCHALIRPVENQIMSKPKPAPLPSGTVVGGYQVIKKLAAGGFGVVYLCEDSERHLVALKEYLPSSLAERSPGELTPRVKPEKQPLYRLGLKSFFEEGRSLAQISHTSVVSVLNFFRENETVYMVMNYLQGDTLQDFIVTARDLKRDKVFRESTIRSLFDEILRGLRIVHQHKMLHLDIKPANIFITNENKAVLLDFGAAREVLSKEGNFIRPMYTPGFAAPEMYRATARSVPWTDIYAIGACIYACMQGYPPNDAPQRIEKDRLALSLSRLRNVYSDNLIEVTEWCMSLDPLSRPQSVFALQKELSRETERQYTKLSFSERLKLQLENLTTSAKA
jgi:serine/threonine protein kinase